MIVIIGSEKGGTGKTTIATNLAAMHSGRGMECLLVDTDKQSSSNYWSNSRDEDSSLKRVTCVQKLGKSVGKEILALSEKYKDIIVDSGGRDTYELRSALTVADYLYVPIQPAQFDIWTLSQMDSLLEEVSLINPKLKTFVVFNRVSTNPVIKEVDEAVSLLENYKNLKFSGIILRERISYRKAAAQGASVGEIKNIDPKAVCELTALYDYVFSRP